MKTPLRSTIAAVALATLPAVVQAQFDYTTNEGTIEITHYTGPDGAVTTPDTISGLPVTRIGDSAFLGCTGLTSVTIPQSVTFIGVEAFRDCGLTSITIPNSVTSIGDAAFAGCTNLTSITLPNSVTNIGEGAFGDCWRLTRVTIPNGVTSIGEGAFHDCLDLTNAVIGNSVVSIGRDAFFGCTSLTGITIPNSVTSIGGSAFGRCTSLMGVHFQGNAPSVGPDAFLLVNNVTVYYLPGAVGWGPTFGGRPTAFWVLPNPVILTATPSFGVQTNRFGFMISWATNASVVVEACTDLAQPNWSPARTNTLSEGWSLFTDPQWTNHANRFYRLRSP